MVEIPSHFLEQFLQSEECLSLCCKHYITGDTMPRHVQRAVQRYWEFMPALDMSDTVSITTLNSNSE